MSEPWGAAGNPGRSSASIGLIPRRPAVAAAGGIMLGVFLRRAVPVFPSIWVAVAGFLTLAAVRAFGRAGLSTFLLLTATVSAGVALAQVERFYHPRDHVSAFATEQPRLAQVELSLDNPPRVLTWPFGQYRALPPKQVVAASVRRIKTWSGWVDCTGDVLVQIGQPHPRLRQGQIVRAIGTLERPGPAMNPGQFDWASYYREQRVLASVQISHADNITILEQRPIGPIAWLRARVRQALALGFDANDSLDHALLQALLLGDKDPELRDVQEQFRRTGTSHHLAISGLHVAVLGGVVFGACRLLRLGPRTSCWAALAFVVLYGVVALPSPPVIRSVILCAAIALGILQKRSSDAVQLLAVSVIAMLVYHPLDLFNAGFQLSFGTVLGLMLFTRPVMAMLPGRDIDQEIAEQLLRLGRFSVLLTKLKHGTRATVAASIVAWVVSMPLVAFHFEQLNPWAILASIVLAPFVFLALIAGFAKVLLTLLWPGLGETWSNIAVTPVAWMRHVVDWLATFPGADIPLPAPPVWMLALYYALLVAALLIEWRPPVLMWAVRLAALAGCVVLAALPLRDGLASVRANAGDLRVTLLAIGAGQCALIEPPGGDAVLIDAGSAAMSDVLRKVLGPYLRHQGRRDVRSIFLSHANLDHFSAVADVVVAYDVADVYAASQFRRHSVDNPPAEYLLRTLDRLDRPPRNVNAGQTSHLGGGATLDVLWPAPDCPYDANNASLVMRLSFGGRSVLFTGDIQGAAERDLTSASSEALRADVLIAPHHGSWETTTNAFVAAVSPSVIVSSNDRTLSVKQRDFDREMRARVVYRTHTSGAITIRITPQGELVVERHLQKRNP